jgi:hypothetical protein
MLPIVNAVYTVEAGLQPWDAKPQPAADGHATLTCAAVTSDMLIGQVDRLLHASRSSFPELLRWCTHGWVFEGNALQRRRFQAAMSTPPQGFAGTILCGDVGGGVNVGIPSNVSYLLLPFRRAHLDALVSYSRCLLVMAAKAGAEPQGVCVALAPFRSGLDARVLASAVAAQPEWVLARFFDQDPFLVCAAQFYAGRARLQPLVDALEATGYRRRPSRADALAWLAAARRPP